MNGIAEFKKFLSEKQPRKIIFMSENQDDFDVADPFVLSVAFSSIFVGENPNVVYITDGANSVRLNMVKRIKVQSESSVIGTEVKVSCLGREREKTYTLLVS